MPSVASMLRFGRYSQDQSSETRHGARHEARHEASSEATVRQAEGKIVRNLRLYIRGWYSSQVTIISQSVASTKHYHLLRSARNTKDNLESPDEALRGEEQSQLLLLEEVLHPWNDMRSAAFGGGDNGYHANYSLGPQRRRQGTSSLTGYVARGCCHVLLGRYSWMAQSG